MENKSADYCLILCTCPDPVSAESIATNLVNNKLAACVNIVTGITSIYQWQGKVEKSQEHLLLIKTKSVAFKAVETAFKYLKLGIDAGVLKT